MLEHDDRKRAAAELIGSFPCLVELPDDLRNNFEKHGVMPFNENDRRRYPRVFCRSRRNRSPTRRSRGSCWVSRSRPTTP